MWGFGVIDILISILKFEDFKEQSFLGKIKWIVVLYPFALIMLLCILMEYCFMWLYIRLRK
jgi:hypothetical protein